MACAWHGKIKDLLPEKLLKSPLVFLKDDRSWSKQSTYFCLYLGGIEEYIEKSFVVKAYAYLLWVLERERRREGGRTGDTG